MSFIIENFELLSERPEHVRELKKLILELAIRGKLVEQKLEDIFTIEPLKKMREEKALLFKQKKIKRPKKYPPISQNEIPFGIPEKWEWARLEDISHDFGQKKPDKKFSYIDVSSINRELGTISEDIKILLPNEAPSRARKIVSKGCVIYSTVRPYLLNIAIIQKEFEFEPIVSTAFAILNPLSLLNEEYLFYYLRSQTFIDYVESQMLGMAYPAINDKNFFQGLIPLPPLAEQKRIVQKVNSLFQKIDALAKQSQQAQVTRQKLRNAYLHRLDQANSATQLSQAWQSLMPQFELVFDSVDAIQALRKSILQLAVKGKLVPQDEADEPASVLLEKIKKEKERLMEEGKIKKQKALPKIEKEEIPYDVPEGWVWCRFGEIISGIDSGWSPKCHSYPATKNEWGVLKVSAVSWNVFNSKENKKLPADKEPRKDKGIRKGDYLMTRANTAALIAKSVIVEDDYPYLMMSDKILRVKFLNLVSPYFIKIVNNGEIGRQYFSNRATGTSDSMRNVSRQIIKELIIPLPPLAEQKRIFKKVGQLMSWCDELELLLEKREQQQERLLGRVLRGVFEEEVEQV